MLIPLEFSFPNPIGWAAKEAASSAFDAACQQVWNFAVHMLAEILNFMDTVGHPNLETTGSAALAQVYPITLWLGLFLAVVLGTWSTARIAITRGQSGGEFAVGFAKFAFFWGVGLTIVQILANAADLLAVGILRQGLHIDNWAGLSDQMSWLEQASRTAGSAGMLICGILFIIPASIGFLIESVIRAGAIEIIAATLPILLAGSLAKETQRWLQLAVRWLLALICLPVLIALVMTIGLSIAIGATGAGGTGTGGVSALGELIIGSTVMLLSLGSPWVLFKLFAFVDNSVAAFSGTGRISPGGNSQAPTAVPANSEGGGDADGAVDARTTAGGISASGIVRGPGSGYSDTAAARSAATLDSVGVGHQGVGGYGNGSTGSTGSTGSNGSNGSNGSDGSDPAVDGGGDAPTPAPPPPAPSTGASPSSTGTPTPSAAPAAGGAAAGGAAAGGASAGAAVAAA